MDNELEKIWESHLSQEKLNKVKAQLDQIKDISVPINLKAKILNPEPSSSKLRYSLLPLSAICLLMFLLFNTKSQDSYQISLHSEISSNETRELDSVLSFYLEDDNFNLTLSELSILEEEGK